MSFSEWFSIVNYWFFQKALLVSLLAAIPCAIIGTLIVVKRISMITGSISHATFGGLGISYFFGFNPLIGAALFGIACGGSIGFLQKKAQNRLDTILSFLWAFGMAIGVLFVYMKPGYSGDLFTYLFGNIFLISNEQMIVLVIMNFIVLGIMILMYHTTITVLFDEEFAEVRNMPILITYLIFYTLVALTIVIILAVVGIILLIAFLTLPPAIALFYKKTMKSVMILSGLLLAGSNILGLFIGHWLNLPPGPVIILVLSLIYLVSFVMDAIYKRSKQKIENIQPHACQLELDSFGIFQEYIEHGKSHAHNHGDSNHHVNE
jgi:zinc transport system permease protein